MSGSFYSLNSQYNSLLALIADLPSNLDEVLANGNNAGGQSITGVNDISLNTINGLAYPPATPSANLTSVVLNYPDVGLVSGVNTQNNLAQSLILTGGKWLIQTQYKIFSGTASLFAQQLIGSVFTLEGFGGLGSSTSSQEYLLSTFTGGGYTSKLTFTHHTTAIVSNALPFTMVAKVFIPSQSLSGGCFGAGQATAVRIGDA